MHGPSRPGMGKSLKISNKKCFQGVESRYPRGKLMLKISRGVLFPCLVLKSKSHVSFLSLPIIAIIARRSKTHLLTARKIVNKEVDTCFLDEDIFSMIVDVLILC